MAHISVNVSRQPDIRFLDGGLPHQRGVKSYQILRANRALPDTAEGLGWTYNHAPMLAWYHGRYYAEYLSNPVNEHDATGHTLLSSSADGVEWTRPEVIFPSIEVPLDCYRGRRADGMPASTATCAHQRMGFYCAKNGVMLVLCFYGIAYDHRFASPCDGWGVGRAVRRLFPDGSLGEIFFLIYNEAAGYTQANVPSFSHFKNSTDTEFKAACLELLVNRRVMNQMYEEQRKDQSLFPMPLGKAPCFYTAADGKTVTLFKLGLSMLTWEGEAFGKIVENPDIKTSMGKVWGQATPDGRYALIYNPTPDGQHRWPLAVVSGEDGYCFGNMRALTADFAPARYGGRDKNPGPQYVRGIIEGNPRPENVLPAVYSVNKEDIWISLAPLPLKDETSTEIHENFHDPSAFACWSVYSPVWAPVRLREGELCLIDTEPADMGRAERCLPPCEKGEIRLGLRVDAACPGSEVCVWLRDDMGGYAGGIVFDGEGRALAYSAGRTEDWTTYEVGKQLSLRLAFDCAGNCFEAELDGTIKRFRLSSARNSVSLLSMCTKGFWSVPYPTLSTLGKYGTFEQVLPGSECPIPPRGLSLISFNFKRA
ncbi:MAG: hypothetical protein K5663_02810 [Clostridiales bacterium]|nr:hypothetical protein [Clostridiales bacterium]